MEVDGGAICRGKTINSNPSFPHQDYPHQAKRVRLRFNKPQVLLLLICYTWAVLLSFLFYYYLPLARRYLEGLQLMAQFTLTVCQAPQTNEAYLHNIALDWSRLQILFQMNKLHLTSSLTLLSPKWETDSKIERELLLPFEWWRLFYY